MAGNVQSIRSLKCANFVAGNFDENLISANYFKFRILVEEMEHQNRREMEHLVEQMFGYLKIVPVRLEV